MVVVLRTDDESPASRLDYWRHIVGDALVQLDMSTEPSAEASPGDYWAKMAYADLGVAQFAEMTAAPLRVARTSKLIRQSDPGLYKIEMQTRGTSVITQRGRETVLRAGDVSIVDTSRPYQMAAGYPTSSVGVRTRAGAAGAPQLLTLLIPHSALPLPVDIVRTVAGAALTGRTPTSGLLAATLGQMARCTTAGEEATAARLATVVVDLLAIGLARVLDRERTIAPERRRRSLVRSIQTFIDAHLDDAELSPATIASAHHISLRYLHKLFEPEGTTVAEWVRRRRLEHCHHELIDPALRDRSVAAVAARWGFASTAHFTRLFRTTYGLPPATYRQLHLESAHLLAS